MALHRETPRYSSGKNQRGTQPPRELQRHIMGRRLTIDELFVDGRSEQVPGDFLTKMRKVARCRLIGAFVHATDPRNKKGTDSSIIGCDHTVSSLVAYVTTNMQHACAFVRPGDLPAQYAHLNNHWRELVRAEARRLLLTETLLGTQPNQSGFAIEGILGTRVMYDPCVGLWLAGRSLLAEYDALREEIGETVTPAARPRKQK